MGQLSTVIFLKITVRPTRRAAYCVVLMPVNVTILTQVLPATSAGFHQQVHPGHASQQLHSADAAVRGVGPAHVHECQQCARLLASRGG